MFRSPAHSYQPASTVCMYVCMYVSIVCLPIYLSIFRLLREKTIAAIPKPGKDSSDPNNYIPMCKTMERMAKNRLMWVLGSKGLLASEQCSLRKNRSTADHLVRFDSYVRNAFAKKNTFLPFFLFWKKSLRP